MTAFENYNRNYLPTKNKQPTALRGSGKMSSLCGAIEKKTSALEVWQS